MDPFPPTNSALSDPNGLLAVGGDLTPSRLLEAYRRGIFPWYEAGEPILWWTPSPRAVLFPDDFHESRSFKKFLKTCCWTVEFDRQFEHVVEACAQPAKGRLDTWISDEMKRAYTELHRLGYAHSVEVMDQDQLVGGLYGVKLGSVFFGESMFSRSPNASKLALRTLCNLGSAGRLTLIDCQMPNEHLQSLGMTMMTREAFEDVLRREIGDFADASSMNADLGGILSS